MAFQVLGAPWLNPTGVLDRLEPSTLAGVEVTPTVFTPVAPTDGKYPGIELPGLRVHVRDRAQYDPTRLAVALLVAIRAAHSTEFQFRAASFDRLAAGPELRLAVLAGKSAVEIWAPWDVGLARFGTSRARYLLSGY
jgi:uncharacterized protein YbbC (DUF1343 family)